MSKANSTSTTLDDSESAAVAAASKETAAIEVIGKNHDDALSGERKIITIHASKEEGGKDAVFVGVNGYAYQIPRGKPCSVPVEVIEVMENAVSTNYETSQAGEVSRSDTPRHNFNVKG